MYRKVEITMLLGLGYLPIRTGPAIWQAFDVAEIQDDLARISPNSVSRPYACPCSGPISSQAWIASTRACWITSANSCKSPETTGLSVKAGLWTGMWDGALWWPDWGVNPAPLPPHWPLIVNDHWVHWGRIRHPFTDERMLQARDLLVQELVSFYGEHPALLGWEPVPGFGRLAAAADRSAVLDWLGSTTDILAFSRPADDQHLPAGLRRPGNLDRALAQ